MNWTAFLYVVIVIIKMLICHSLIWYIVNALQNILKLLIKFGLIGGVVMTCFMIYILETTSIESFYFCKIYEKNKKNI